MKDIFKGTIHCICPKRVWGTGLNSIERLMSGTRTLIQIANLSILFGNFIFKLINQLLVKGF